MRDQNHFQVATFRNSIDTAVVAPNTFGFACDVKSIDGNV